MPDAHVLLASFKSELATLDRRRAELRGQLEELEHEYQRLETTVAVLEDRVGAVSQVGPADAREDVPLADRIVDALGATGLRRPEMLRIFVGQGFTPSAIDSAANRLTKRGRVRREGRRIVRVVPSSEPAQPVAPDLVGVDPPDSGAGRMSPPESVDRGPDEPPASGGVPGPVSSGAAVGDRVADDDGGPMTQRVRAAVQAGVDTREALVDYFAARGVSAARPVNRAVWDLRKKGVLEDVDGKLVVAAVEERDRSPLNGSLDPGSSSRRP